jgi:hypothetical protein
MDETNRLMPVSSALGSSVLLPAGLGHRNKIINGDMRIAQRGTATITGSSSAQFPVDRWAVFNVTVGNNVTFVQSTDAPAGFTNSLLATVSNAAGSYESSGYTQITHKIEGFNCQDLAYGTASAKTIVLSFWVKSSVVGTYNVSLHNGGDNRAYIAKYTINVANTWEQKTISIVGDTTGTWLVNSGIGLEVAFNLGMGTGYDSTTGSWLAGYVESTSDAIDFAATANATFRVTGVQLEQNYQPTPFEQRPIGVELALCQRYYFRYYGKSGGYGRIPSTGSSYGGTVWQGVVSVPTTMRATPSSIDYSGIGCTDNVSFDSAAFTGVALNTANSHPDGLFIVGSGGSGINTGSGQILILRGEASAYFGISAEL